MPQAERTCPRCQIVFVPGKLEDSCPACLFADTVDFVNDDDGTRAFWEDKPLATASPGRSFSHFDLLDELGRGGMGTVYRARDRATERIVALKVLQAHHLFEIALVQRFRSEVRAISSLDHRHILPVHEVGEYDGVPFFSMKLASGGSLAQRLSEYVGHPRRAAQLLVKVARGVQHAHERGVLHRDLKPGNILLDEADEPYVCDFGLAKWMEDDRRLTLTSVVLGTPHYIAPEQASGKQGTLTLAADIYSLGAILYELLTGRPPFVGETAFDTLRQASQNSPAKPSSIVNGTPRDLETICLKALEREPAARYATAAALADDLDHWIAGRPIRARPVGAAEQLWRWARRNPVPAALSATLIAALVTLAVSTSIAAIKIDRSRTRAVAAEQDAKEKLSDSLRSEARATAAEQDAREKLYQSLLLQARASRQTGKVGHRIETLKAIKEAVAIRPSLELRNEAIAALSLVDLDLVRQVKTFGSSIASAVDSTLTIAAVATKEGDIEIVRLSDGSLQKTISGTGHPIRTLFGVSSHYVVARCRDDAVYVWSFVSGALLHKHPGHPAPIIYGYSNADIAISPDETCLAIGSPDGIRIVAADTGTEIRHLKTTQPICIVFSPDGKQIAWGNADEKTIKVLDIETQNSVIELALRASPRCVSWSPDQSKIAIGCIDFAIQLIATDKWRVLGSLEGHKQPVAKIVFRQQGDILLSSADDRTVRLWDVQTQSDLVTIPGTSRPSLTGFSPDGLFVYIGQHWNSSSTLKLVGLTKSNTIISPPVGEELVFDTASIDYSSDSILLATGSSHAVQIFDAKHGTLLKTKLNTIATQTTVRFLPDGKTLAILPRRDGLSLNRFSYSEGKLEFPDSETYQGEFAGYQFTSKQYNNSALICIAKPTYQSQKNQGIVWDSVSGEIVRTYDNEPGLFDLVVSPDRRLVASSYMAAASMQRDTTIRLFSTSEPVARLPDTRGSTLSFSPSGRWLAGSINKIPFMLWDTRTWTRGPALPPEVDTYVRFFAFSDDETLLAASISTAQEIRLVSLPSGAPLATLESSTSIPRVRFSPDGTQLAVQGSDNSLALWDLPELRRQLRELNLDWEDEPVVSSQTAAAAVGK